MGTLPKINFKNLTPRLYISNYENLQNIEYKKTLKLI